MISNERKIKLFAEMLWWALEVINNKEDIEIFLKNMGFSSDEIKTIIFDWEN